MAVFPVTGPASVRLEVQMGHVEVFAEPRDDVSVEVVPANPNRSGDIAAADAVRVTHTGADVSIIGPSRLSIFGPGDNIDVVVRVPEASEMSATVKYGAVHLKGTLGDTRLVFGYGDASIESVGKADLELGHVELRIGQIRGDADMTFKSGHARIGRVDGALKVKGSHAGIDVGSVGGAADITTATGAVELGDPGPALTISSAHGSVRVKELTRGAARIQTTSAAITLGVRRGAAVWLDASSQKGVIRNELSADAGPPAEGEETLELYARTGHGAITLYHAPPGAAH